MSLKGETFCCLFQWRYFNDKKYTQNTWYTWLHVNLLNNCILHLKKSLKPKQNLFFFCSVICFPMVFQCFHVSVYSSIQFFCIIIVFYSLHHHHLHRHHLWWRTEQQQQQQHDHWIKNRNWKDKLHCHCYGSKLLNMLRCSTQLNSI